jgi:hypothetical protein
MTPMRRLREYGHEVPLLDLAKRDLIHTRGGRTFAVRAYLDGSHPAGPGWHAIIVENRTPLRHTLSPTGDAGACLAAAIRFLNAAVAADAGAANAATREREEDRQREQAWESEGGAPARGRDGSLASDTTHLRREIHRAAVPPGAGGRITP